MKVQRHSNLVVSKRGTVGTGKFGQDIRNLTTIKISSEQRVGPSTDSSSRLRNRKKIVAMEANDDVGKRIKFSVDKED